MDSEQDVVGSAEYGRTTSGVLSGHPLRTYFNTLLSTGSATVAEGFKLAAILAVRTSAVPTSGNGWSCISARRAGMQAQNKRMITYANLTVSTCMLLLLPDFSPAG